LACTGHDRGRPGRMLVRTCSQPDP
jgi:hypothetical protein